ncbi:MFS general substrate transporter [Clavulina sp. PMI_390]|nr:MFS general substrate transporter [Clavulina sp. PMI_390]
MNDPTTGRSAEKDREEENAEEEAEIAADHDVGKYIVDGRDTRYMVGWDGPDDPANPMNWSSLYRWWLTFFSGLITLNASFSSSAPSGVIGSIGDDFGFGSIVGNLLISVFIAGYCVGPLLWGPASESFGRRPIFIFSFWVYAVFQLACAVAPNTGALLAFRFLGGCFAASPLTNAGAVLADIWTAKTRGKAMALFTVAPFAGPALGPIVSGFIDVSGTSWRYVILFWVLFGFAGACALAITIILPETYAPILLKQKAQRLRKSTGDERWYAPVEAIHIPALERASGILLRPWKILFLEPMLLAITIYTSFIYGVLYLCFEAFPIIYVDGHNFNIGVDGLTFLPLFIGGAIGCLMVLFYYNPQYSKLVDEYKPNPVPPEARLPMGVVGSIAFTISLFWIAWSSYPGVNYWVPIIGSLPLGVSITLIFLCLINYIVDVYLQVAASALAANTVVRSSFGAGFPLFAPTMYHRLNPRWATTLLGFIALLMVPIPVLFIRYGPYLRSKSRFSPTAKKTGVVL